MFLFLCYVLATPFDDDNENLEDRYRSPYGSTLRTFDATDYSSIGTQWILM